MIKNERGITLIALIVTIIVLLILAGSNIVMLLGDNGILQRAGQAKNINEIAKYEENVKLAQTAAKTKISSNIATYDGYIATTKDNVREVSEDVVKDFGLKIDENKKSTSDTLETEGYTVAYYSDTEGDSSKLGDGYVVIWYTANTLRSSLDVNNAISTLGLINTVDDWNDGMRNQLVLVTVMHITNNNCELSNMAITTIANANADLEKTWFSETSIYNLSTAVNKTVNAAKLSSEIATRKGKNSPIGRNIGYKVESYSGEWELFYADNNNIYIIAKGIGSKYETLKDPIYNQKTLSSCINKKTYSEGSKLLTSDISNYPAVQAGWLDGYKNGNDWYSSNTENIQATLFMLDSVNVWNSKYKNDMAEYAIGAPTLELFCKSFGAYSGGVSSYYDSAKANKSTGYPAVITSGIAEGTIYNHNVNYWLASPSNGGDTRIRFIRKDTKDISSDLKTAGIGFRPIVCLKSNVELEWNEAEERYDIK